LGFGFWIGLKFAASDFFFWREKWKMFLKEIFMAGCQAVYLVGEKI
jgi:hypothetical protein